MKLAKLLTLVLALAVWPSLSGCATASQAQIEQTIHITSKNATMGALYAMKATPETTAKVRDIAQGVATITTGGYIDYAMVRDEIIRQIELSFTGEEAVLLIALGTDLTNIVLTYVPPTSPESTLIRYTNHAALGAVEGCDTYAQIQAAAGRAARAPRPPYLDLLRVKSHADLK